MSLQYFFFQEPICGFLLLNLTILHRESYIHVNTISFHYEGEMQPWTCGFSRKPDSYCADIFTQRIFSALYILSSCLRNKKQVFELCMWRQIKVRATVSCKMGKCLRCTLTQNIDLGAPQKGGGSIPGCRHGCQGHPNVFKHIIMLHIIVRP